MEFLTTLIKNIAAFVIIILGALLGLGLITSFDNNTFNPDLDKTFETFAASAPILTAVGVAVGFGKTIYDSGDQIFKSIKSKFSNKGGPENAKQLPSFGSPAPSKDIDGTKKTQSESQKTEEPQKKDLTSLANLAENQQSKSEGITL